MRKLVVLGAAAALVAGSACSTLGRAAWEEPVVTLQNVQLLGLGTTGGSLDVLLNVYNPNGFRLDATELTYRVFVDTVHVANGIVDSDFTVQAGDSSTVRIPVSFTYAGIGRAAQSLMQTGTVNYRVTGDVRVGTPIGSFSVPYDQSGRFSTLRR